MSWIIKASPKVIRTEEDLPEPLKVGDRVRIRPNMLEKVSSEIHVADRSSWVGTIDIIRGHMPSSGRNVNVEWESGVSGDYKLGWLELAP